MGCDIHLYFEKRNEEGKWEKLEISEFLVPEDRNYALFGQLAGIRGYPDEGEPWFQERGLPDDYSANKYLGDYGITYATVGEILNCPWERDELELCYFCIFFHHVLCRLVNNGLGIYKKDQKENIRVIMGFDS